MTDTLTEAMIGAAEAGDWDIVAILAAEAGPRIESAFDSPPAPPKDRPGLEKSVLRMRKQLRALQYAWSMIGTSTRGGPGGKRYPVNIWKDSSTGQTVRRKNQPGTRGGGGGGNTPTPARPGVAENSPEGRTRQQQVDQPNEPTEKRGGGTASPQGGGEKAAPKARKPLAPDQLKSKQDVHAALKGLAAGDVTRADVKALAARMQKMSHAELQELKQELQIPDKIDGTKDIVARQLVEKHFGKEGAASGKHKLADPANHAESVLNDKQATPQMREEALNDLNFPQMQELGKRMGIKGRGWDQLKKAIGDKVGHSMPQAGGEDATDTTAAAPPAEQAAPQETAPPVTPQAPQAQAPQQAPQAETPPVAPPERPESPLEEAPVPPPEVAETAPPADVAPPQPEQAPPPAETPPESKVLSREEGAATPAGTVKRGATPEDMERNILAEIRKNGSADLKDLRGRMEEAGRGKEFDDAILELENKKLIGLSKDVDASHFSPEDRANYVSENGITYTSAASSAGSHGEYPGKARSAPPARPETPAAPPQAPPAEQAPPAQPEAPPVQPETPPAQPETPKPKEAAPPAPKPQATSVPKPAAPAGKVMPTAQALKASDADLMASTRAEKSFSNKKLLEAEVKRRGLSLAGETILQDVAAGKDVGAFLNSLAKAGSDVIGRAYRHVTGEKHPVGMKIKDVKAAILAAAKAKAPAPETPPEAPPRPDPAQPEVQKEAAPPPAEQAPPAPPSAPSGPDAAVQPPAPPADVPIPPEVAAKLDSARLKDLRETLAYDAKKAGDEKYILSRMEETQEAIESGDGDIGHELEMERLDEMYAALIREKKGPKSAPVTPPVPPGQGPASSHSDAMPKAAPPRDGFRPAKMAAPSESPGKRAPSPDVPDYSRPEVTPEQADALSEYSTSGYIVFNKRLRREGKSLTGTFGEMHDDLQKVFDKTPEFDRPVKVYRTANTKGGTVLLDAMRAAAESGRPITIPGYTSTSTRKVDRFIKKADLIFEIDARRGVDLKPYSRNPSEWELLLNHNSRFRVTGVTRSPDGKHIVRMEQLPDGEGTDRAAARAPGSAAQPPASGPAGAGGRPDGGVGPGGTGGGDHAATQKAGGGLTPPVSPPPAPPETPPAPRLAGEEGIRALDSMDEGAIRKAAGEHGIDAAGKPALRVKAELVKAMDPDGSIRKSMIAALEPKPEPLTPKPKSKMDLLKEAHQRREGEKLRKAVDAMYATGGIKKPSLEGTLDDAIKEEPKDGGDIAAKMRDAVEADSASSPEARKKAIDAMVAAEPMDEIRNAYAAHGKRKLDAKPLARMSEQELRDWIRPQIEKRHDAQADAKFVAGLDAAIKSATPEALKAGYDALAEGDKTIRPSDGMSQEVLAKEFKQLVMGERNALRIRNEIAAKGGDLGNIDKIDPGEQAGSGPRDPAALVGMTPKAHEALFEAAHVIAGDREQGSDGMAIWDALASSESGRDGEEVHLPLGLRGAFQLVARKALADEKDPARKAAIEVAVRAAEANFAKLEKERDAANAKAAETSPAGPPKPASGSLKDRLGEVLAKGGKQQLPVSTLADLQAAASGPLRGLLDEALAKAKKYGMKNGNVAVPEELKAEMAKLANGLLGAVTEGPAREKLAKQLKPFLGDAPPESKVLSREGAPEPPKEAVPPAKPAGKAGAAAKGGVFGADGDKNPYAAHNLERARDSVLSLRDMVEDTGDDPAGMEKAEKRFEKLGLNFLSAADLTRLYKAAGGKGSPGTTAEAVLSAIRGQAGLPPTPGAAPDPKPAPPPAPAAGPDIMPIIAYSGNEPWGRAHAETMRKATDRMPAGAKKRVAEGLKGVDYKKTQDEVHDGIMAGVRSRVENATPEMMATVAATYIGNGTWDAAKGEKFKAADDGMKKAMLLDEQVARINKTLLGEKFGGGYSANDGRITINGAEGLEKNLQGGMAQYNVPVGNVGRHAYAHELTHAIDGPGKEYSGSPEWQAAWEAEIKPGGKLTRYAASRDAEGFAEFGRLLYASDAPPADIERDFPLASKFFKDRGLWPGA